MHRPSDGFWVPTRWEVQKGLAQACALHQLGKHRRRSPCRLKAPPDLAVTRSPTDGWALDEPLHSSMNRFGVRQVRHRNEFWAVCCADCRRRRWDNRRVGHFCRPQHGGAHIFHLGICSCGMHINFFSLQTDGCDQGRSHKVKQKSKLLLCPLKQGLKQKLLLQPRSFRMNARTTPGLSVPTKSSMPVEWFRTCGALWALAPAKLTGRIPHSSVLQFPVPPPRDDTCQHE